ncbi:MAG: hypothetical protein LCI00_20430 [Chloroflexi bacterium]|nr:hypothetical protein [Chloroflexota bacterium]MCC6893716.1 hypothetical protein [Anaerolineae bacterium]
MAIDHVIDYKCYPKQELTTEGIIERIKGRARAEAVIKLFRDNGDNRPVSEIGFELERMTASGESETKVVMVQNMLDQADELLPFHHYCEGCPANNLGTPFGCISQIEYPISGRAELWLLNQLPIPTETLPWMLLRQGLREFKAAGEAVNSMRAEGQPFFQEKGVLVRQLGEMIVNSNQLFEMLFLLGHIKPSYGATLLMFFNIIRRNMDADTIMALTPSPDDAAENYPLLIKSEPDDDASIQRFKTFFRALYLAWALNVRLLLDV